MSACASLFILGWTGLPGAACLYCAGLIVLAASAVFAICHTLMRRHQKQIDRNLIEAKRLLSQREEEAKALNEQLHASNQQLKASLQQLDAVNQQLRAEEQQLRAMNIELANNEKALLESRAHYQHIAANVPGIVYQFRRNSDGYQFFTYISPKCQTILNIAPEKIQNNWKAVLEIIHPDDRTALESAIATSAATLTTWNWEGRIIVNGTPHWIQGIAHPQPTEDGAISWDGILLDITDRKKMEQELRASRQMLRLILDTIPVRVFWKDRDSVYLGCNRAFAKDAGLADSNQIIGRTDYDLAWRDQAELYRKDDREVILSGRPKLGYEEPQSRLDRANVCWLRTNKTPLLDVDGNIIGVLGTYEDITEHRQAEDRIRASLKEKEILLREIHHRVKNNLQVISSLLNLQASQIVDPRDTALFAESQARVRAMALVHEKLYQSTDLAHINFHEYLLVMASELQQIFGRADITLEVDAKAMLLTIEKAIPCALIIHELATNALKYAFPPTAALPATPKKISIRLYEKEGKNWCISAQDNGIGFPPDLDITKTRTLGLQLVLILTRQLNGEWRLQKSPGTTFEITFPKG